jgi:hypothetical protein
MPLRPVPRRSSLSKPLSSLMVRRYHRLPTSAFTDQRPLFIGMPYPHNLNTALSLESIIKSESNNAVLPATIALLSGRIHIGLTRAELSSMSEPSDSSSTKPQSIKVSRRDLTQALARGLNGGTTVAGTMILADQVGIELFVTGGIGGVHRGATQSEFQAPSLLLLRRLSIPYRNPADLS